MCFVGFCRLYVLLSHERNIVNKQPGPTLFTNINGYLICYITAKRFAFPSVGTNPARKKDICSNILNWFWTVFKNVNPLAQTTEKELVWSSEGILRTWHTDAQCGHWWSLLSRDWKVFLCRQSLPDYFVFGQYTFRMRKTVLLSYPQSGVNALHIATAFNYFTLVCNIIPVLVEQVNFAMVKADNFCKNKLIAV